MSKPITTRHGPSAIPAAEYYEAGPEFNVGSWCPTPDGSGPPQQVHLRFGTPPGNCMLVRFKGPDSLDALIDALLEHRQHVFGKRGEPAAVLAEREACAQLHESINPACDHERPHVPGAGAMGAVIAYRDAIRARSKAGGR